MAAAGANTLQLELSRCCERCRDELCDFSLFLSLAFWGKVSDMCLPHCLQEITAGNEL